MSTAEPLRTLGLLAMRWSGLALALGVAAAQMWVEAAVAMLVALAQVVGAGGGDCRFGGKQPVQRPA